MATSLKHVNYSKTGEQAQSQEMPPINDAPDVAPKEFLPQNTMPGSQHAIVGEQYVIFKLKDTKRRGGSYLPNIDDVYNEKSGMIERIRLLVGVNTIWYNEQVKLGITEDYAQRNLRSIHFPRGQKMMRVSSKDKNLIEFMRAANNNIENPHRTGGGKFPYYEWNPKREAQLAEERELKQIEMAIKAREMSEEKMMRHASFLKIQPYNDMGIPKLPAQMRTDYIIFAKRNPELFEKTVDSEEVDIQYAIKMAITNSKIDIGTQPGTAMWTNSKGIICRIPAGFEAIKYLTDLALTNSAEGRRFREELKNP